MAQVYILVHSEARRRAKEAIDSAPDGWACRIGEPKRNEEQSAKFHALCTDAAKSNVEWMGKRRTKNQWKSLFISGHAIATGLDAEIVPGLEGEFLNIRESSADMGKKRAGSLIEYTQAWCVSNGVELNEFHQVAE